MLNPVHLLRWLVALALLRRLSHGRRRRAALRAGERPRQTTRVSVVVPARDEEDRLGPCLDGLLADPRLHEVLVVDDRSTDATASLAAARGATVLRGAEPPDGWKGKTWALEQGLRKATGDVVVFLDADARPAPGLAAALAARLEDDALDLVSAMPAFRAPDPGLHAALAVTLPLRLGPGDALGWTPPRPVLNGQCLAVRRERLLAAGGWARVRGHTTEDLALARALRAEGWTLGMVDAADLLVVEPYPTARATLEGWSRSLMASDVWTPREQAADLATLWVAMVLPWLRLATRRADRLDVVLLAVRLGLHGALARAHRPRGPRFWLGPAWDVPVVVRLTFAVLRPSRSWRGRES